MTAGRGLPSSPGAATVTTSPRIEDRNRLDPAHRFFLVLGIELGDRGGHPAAHGRGVRVGHDEAQFAETARTAPLAHELHSFGRRHGDPPPAVTRDSVTRYEAAGKGETP